MTFAFSWRSERRPPVDLTGQRFGLVTALSLAPTLGSGARWRCRCDCGHERVIDAQTLKKGVTSHRYCPPRKETTP